MNKRDILNLVHEYAEEKLNNTVFIPGISPVPVSGAVLFPEDITEVADALLEFWYTYWTDQEGKCSLFPN